MSLVRNALFWIVALVAIAVVTVALWLPTFLALAYALESTSLNTWGDVEGLIVPFWIVYFALVTVGIGGLVWLRRRRQMSPSDSQSPT